MFHKTFDRFRSLIAAPVQVASLRPPPEENAPPTESNRPSGASQISLESSDLVRAYVVAVATAPTQYKWDRLVCYVEVSRDADGRLSVVDTGRPYLNGRFIPEPIPGNIASYKALENYFEFSEKAPNCWRGIAIDISAHGRYFVSYFYDACLDRDEPDHQEVNRRLDTVMSRQASGPSVPNAQSPASSGGV